MHANKEYLTYSVTHLPIYSTFHLSVFVPEHSSSSSFSSLYSLMRETYKATQKKKVNHMTLIASLDSRALFLKNMLNVFHQVFETILLLMLLKVSLSFYNKFILVNQLQCMSCIFYYVEKNGKGRSMCIALFLSSQT